MLVKRRRIRAWPFLKIIRFRISRSSNVDLYIWPQRDLSLRRYLQLDPDLRLRVRYEPSGATLSKRDSLCRELQEAGSATCPAAKICRPIIVPDEGRGARRTNVSDLGALLWRREPSALELFAGSKCLSATLRHQKLKWRLSGLPSAEGELYWKDSCTTWCATCSWCRGRRDVPCRRDGAMARGTRVNPALTLAFDQPVSPRRGGRRG